MKNETYYHLSKEMIYFANRAKYGLIELSDGDSDNTSGDILNPRYDG